MVHNSVVNYPLAVLAVLFCLLGGSVLAGSVQAAGPAVSISNLSPAVDDHIDPEGSSITTSATITGFDAAEHDVRLLVRANQGVGGGGTLGASNVETDGDHFERSFALTSLDSYTNSGFDGTFRFEVTVFEKDGSANSSSDVIAEMTTDSFTVEGYEVTFDLVGPGDGETAETFPFFARVNISQGNDIEASDVKFTLIPDNDNDTEVVTYSGGSKNAIDDGINRYTLNRTVRDVVEDTNMRPGDTFTMEVSVDDREYLGTLEAIDVMLGGVEVRPLITSLTPTTNEEVSFDSDDNTTFTAEVVGFSEDDHDVRFYIDEDGGNGAQYTYDGGDGMLQKNDDVFSNERNLSWFEDIITEDFEGAYTFRATVFDPDSQEILDEKTVSGLTVDGIEPPHIPNPQEDWPSTNDVNRESGDPHVNLVEATDDSVTLELNSDKGYVVNFEIRVDGETPEVYESTGNPLGDNQVADANGDYDVISGDDFSAERYDSEQRDRMYGGCNLFSGSAGHGDFCPGEWEDVDGSLQLTIPASEKVEVRQALGAESSHRFSWVTFEVEESDEDPVDVDPAPAPSTGGGGGAATSRQSGNEDNMPSRTASSDEEVAVSEEDDQTEPEGEVLGAGTTMAGNDEFIAVLTAIAAILQSIQEGLADDTITEVEAADLLTQLSALIATMGTIDA